MSLKVRFARQDRQSRPCTARMSTSIGATGALRCDGAGVFGPGCIQLPGFAELRASCGRTTTTRTATTTTMTTSYDIQPTTDFLLLTTYRTQLVTCNLRSNTLRSIPERHTEYATLDTLYPMPTTITNYCDSCPHFLPTSIYLSTYLPLSCLSYLPFRYLVYLTTVVCDEKRSICLSALACS